MVQLLTAILTVAGAVNWAVAEFVGTDLLIDVLGLSAGSTELQIVYLVIAVAGAVLLYNELVWKEIIEG